MSNSLNIRFYNVRFGDAILITVPDQDPTTGDTTTRRILIDVGNAPTVASPIGGDDSVFKEVIDDILDELAGNPLDLYIVTHEHLDHVQGIPHAAWKLYPDDFSDRFKVNHVWITASAADDYYDRYPDAKKKKLSYERMLNRITNHLKLKGLDREKGFVELLGLNQPTWTRDCVKYLKELNPANTSYIHRGYDLDGKHPFKEVEFSIWAPEEDTSDYFSKLLSVDLGDGPSAGPPGRPSVPDNEPESPLPPPGVDVGAFLNLVNLRSRGLADNLLAIDKAANDSSVVFSMEWRGWKFLFTGDAEEKSWHKMHEHGVLQPVHFLKVAHHGSHNGTPSGEVFDAILPDNPPNDRERYAVISAWEDTYPGIPHPPTDERIASRCTLYTNLQEREELYFDLEFPP